MRSSKKVRCHVVNIKYIATWAMRPLTLACCKGFVDMFVLKVVVYKINNLYSNHLLVAKGGAKSHDTDLRLLIYTKLTIMLAK